MSEIKTYPAVVTLQTGRLILREWRDADLLPFAQLNADPEVMTYFPAPLTAAESDDYAAQIRQRMALHGWGLWALELRETGEFIGLTGLNIPRVALPFMPCVEIGWRLARPFWGQGLVSEAARSVLQFGFTQLNLNEIVSFTALDNLRSQAVMQRLGMRRDATDFEHPILPEGHRLRMHCLYRLQNNAWVCE